MSPSAHHGRGERGLARAAVSGWLWNFGIQASTISLTGLVFLVSSRVLEPKSFGIVAFAAATVALLSAIMPTAFGQALVQREKLDDRHLNSVFWLCFLTGICAYSAIAILAPIIAEREGLSLLAPILLVIGARLIFDAISAVPNALLQRRMEFRALALRSVTANVIAAACCILLIYLGYPLWGLVLSQAINPLISMTVVVAVTRWRPTAFLDRLSLNELSKFGLAVWGGQILHQARMDQLIIGVTLGPAGLGLYFFAHRIYSLLSELTGGAFAGVSNVVFASLQSDKERSKNAFAIASFASTAIGFPVFSGLIVIAPTAIPLAFGSQWVDAIVVVQSLCVIGVMASLGVIQGSMIAYLGQAVWWFRYQLLIQVAGWGIIACLAPFGIEMVAIGLAMRTLFLWPISVWKTSRMLEMRLSQYIGSFAKPALSALVCSVGVLSLPLLAPSLTSWDLLIAQVCLGAALYGVLLVLLARRRIMEARTLWSAGRGSFS